jgi:anti-sigma B factor antagonist
MDISEEARVEFSKQGRVDIGTIHMASVLSPISISEFGEEVLSYVQSRQRLYLLLNFENVDYLSSAVLTELIKIHRAVHDTGGELRLCTVSPTIREIFRITNLDQMLGIHEDELAPNLARFERAIDVAEQDQAWDAPAE